MTITIQTCPIIRSSSLGKGSLQEETCCLLAMVTCNTKLAFNSPSTAVHKLKVADSVLTEHTDYFFDRVKAVVESIDNLFGRENVLIGAQL